MVAAAAMVMVAACVGADDAPPEVERVAERFEVERVTATGAVPWRGPIGVMDEVLVGLRPQVFAESDGVVVSDDGGRTWSVAELPDRPAALVLATTEEGLYVDDEVAAVVGRDPTSASPVFPIALPQFIVWTTTDGHGWTAHVLTTAGGVVGTPTVTAVGPLLVASTGSAEGFNLFTSDDRGASWRRAEVTGLDLLAGVELRPEAGTGTAEGGALRLVVASASFTSPGPGHRRVLASEDGGSTWSAQPCGPDCPDPSQAGDLLHRYGETSTDGGATWDPIELEPSSPDDGPTSLAAVHQVPGGWLASAWLETDEVSYGSLLRSDDGRTWRSLLPPDWCADRIDAETPVAESVSDPVRFDGHWYVTFSCEERPTAELGVVYVGDEDGREFEAIVATRRDSSTLGDPVVDHDRLLVPEYDEATLVAITTIRS